jgi:pimeloyl-ACP methyl ester carboxylesterase
MFEMPRAREVFAGFAAGQVADNEMLDALPEGMERFRTVTLPVLLLSGDQSPAHLRQRSDDLAAALPEPPQRATLTGQGHTAHMQAPGAVAEDIVSFIVALAA